MRASKTDRRWQRELSRPLTDDEQAFIKSISPTCDIFDHHLQSVLMQRTSDRRVYWFSPDLTPERAVLLSIWASRLFYGVRPSFSGEQKRLWGMPIVLEGRQDAAVHLPNGKMVYAPDYMRSVIVCPDTQVESLLQLAKQFPFIRLNDDFCVVAHSEFRDWAMRVDDPTRIRRMFVLGPMDDLLMSFASTMAEVFQYTDRPRDNKDVDRMWQNMGLAYKGKSLAHMRFYESELVGSQEFRLTDAGADRIEQYIKRYVYWLPDNIPVKRVRLLERHASGSAGVAQVMRDLANRRPCAVVQSNDKAGKVVYHLRGTMNPVVRAFNRIELNDMSDDAYVVFGGYASYKMFVEKFGMKPRQTAIVSIDLKLREPTPAPVGWRKLD